MLKQTLQQKLLQKLSPQQIQLMKLLQVPTMELEQRIKEEIEGNPALEEGADADEEELREREEYNNTDDNDNDRDEERSRDDDFDISEYMQDDEMPSYKLSANNHSPDDEDRSMPISSGRTFHENLLTQLGLADLDEHERELALTLVGNLDDDGYLRRDLINIVDDLAFSQNLSTSELELGEVLKVIQEFEPAGVGARNLQECLLIQIKRRKNQGPAVQLATRLLEDHFESFTKKHYDKITRRLDVSEEELKAAVDEIIRLNPRPGNSMTDTSRSIQHVVPDFLLSVEDNDIKLSLNGRNAPELRISRTYKDMLQTYAESKEKSKQDKEALMFVKQKIDSAKWFIDAIRQRQETLLYTMNAIVEIQKEYFLTGDETKLKPMILKDVAEKVNLDISTISRVANSKYVQTPYGTFLIKTFFSESLSTDSGEEVSTREVKKILQDAIDQENKSKPLTDDRLAKLLKDKGYNIARRTVAKYREQLNIPVARLRKEL
ncbi:MAG: RNA polymerase sigma-54 factor [Cryomorphaceae bacterium]|nr:MAG: RNA polymerase sigma-54 factor [Cryomorphaceae bacterium]